MFSCLYNHVLIETFCNIQVSENEIMKFNSQWQKSRHMLVAKRRPPTISTEVQYKDVEIHPPIVLEKPLDRKNCSENQKEL